ncbi:hypothetical protein EV645_1634 [Kribbella rubisoli]|uniref:Uncharacterized protein n=1 Tax=Kribbella rubisoli TaxID=3075929 RepID=A0A4Q7X9F4_9ACTN|nr:hypothetical protein EV645_1634 [Kribbella rubisoli]
MTWLVGYRLGVVNVAAVNVLTELGTARWSAPEAMAFEIAQEGVRQAIGFYARPITAEEAAADPEVAVSRRTEQQAWAARGQELTPLDIRAIKRIRKEADDLLIIDDEDEDDDEEADDDGADVDADDDLAEGDEDEDEDDDGTLE